MAPADPGLELVEASELGVIGAVALSEFRVTVFELGVERFYERVTEAIASVIVTEEFWQSVGKEYFHGGASRGAPIEVGG